MTAILDYFRRLRSRQVVRPWALCAPVVVLLIALPLLRPLRSPTAPSDHELTYLASIQALAEADGPVVNDTDAFAALRRSAMLAEGERDKGLGPAAPARRPCASGDAVPGTIVVGG